MGFSSSKYRQDQHDRRWKVNPVWRGIGCVLILLVPIMSWFTAQVFIQSSLSSTMPRTMLEPIKIRPMHVAEIDSVIRQANLFFKDNNLVTGQLFLTVILMFIGFGILSVVYAMMYRVVGPPRYGPFDIPPDVMRK